MNRPKPNKTTVKSRSNTVDSAKVVPDRNYFGTFPTSNLSPETFLSIDSVEDGRQQHADARKNQKTVSSRNAIFARALSWCSNHRILAIAVVLLVVVVLLLGIAFLIVEVIARPNKGNSNSSQPSIPTPASTASSTPVDPSSCGSVVRSAYARFSANSLNSSAIVDLQPDIRNPGSYFTFDGKQALFLEPANLSISAPIKISLYDQGCSGCMVYDIPPSCRLRGYCNSSEIVYCCEKCPSTGKRFCSMRDHQFFNLRHLLYAVAQLSGEDDVILHYATNSTSSDLCALVAYAISSNGSNLIYDEGVEQSCDFAKPESIRQSTLTAIANLGEVTLKWKAALNGSGDETSFILSDFKGNRHEFHNVVDADRLIVAPIGSDSGLIVSTSQTEFSVFHVTETDSFSICLRRIGFSITGMSLAGTFFDAEGHLIQWFVAEQAISVMQHNFHWPDETIW